MGIDLLPESDAGAHMLAGSCGCGPTEHTYVCSKGPWFEITDDLPQAEQLE